MPDSSTSTGLGRRSLLAAATVAAVAARTAVAAEPSTTVWSQDYAAQKGGSRLYLYRKRLAAPVGGGTPLPVLFLSHGSSLSGRTSFDLTVPGAGEYSTMDVFARAGFDVWTMDFEGYGRSDRGDGNSDIASGVADLRAAAAVVTRETGATKFHFMGESSGALRAAAFAIAEPERADRLVLAALTYTGRGSPTLEKRAEQIAFYRSHSRRPRDSESIRSIFTRDKPGTADPRVADALVAAEMPFGDSVPTGTYLDMVASLPIVDPARILSPVLVLRGQYDGIATEEDLLDFYQKLPNPDRQFVILPGSAHAVTLGLNRALLWHSALAFLTAPGALRA